MPAFVLTTNDKNANRPRPTTPSCLELEGTDAFGLDSGAKRFARLFFQPVLVA